MFIFAEFLVKFHLNIQHLPIAIKNFFLLHFAIKKNSTNSLKFLKT